jgi:hypothetical protein
VIRLFASKLTPYGGVLISEDRQAGQADARFNPSLSSAGTTSREGGRCHPCPEHLAITEDEQAELQRLRAEVATLRTQLEQDRAVGQRPSVGIGRVVRQRWRAVVATLLIVVACVLAPLSVVAIWTRNQVTTIDR